jgi:uncharacterized protein YnzC (UPF0291/DUF896 family)
MNQPQTIPKLQSLPNSLRLDGAIKLELEQGIVIFRASGKIQKRIAELIEKEREQALTADEQKELREYEEIDDYLSLINRLIRNSAETVEVDFAA